MKKNTFKISLLFLALIICTGADSGCTFGSYGDGAGWYIDPGTDGGYHGVPTGLPFGTLGCVITYPGDFTKAGLEQSIWIYGVVWREGKDVNAYPWSGPEWRVDGGRIGQSYYVYDRFSPEVWVRFPFNAKIIGLGQHEVTLSVWENQMGIPYEVTDTIYLLIE